MVDKSLEVNLLAQFLVGNGSSHGFQGDLVHLRHRNAEWVGGAKPSDKCGATTLRPLSSLAKVKVIDFNGMIRNLDWHPVYQAPS